MTSGPIQRPSTRAPTGPAQPSETKPADSPETSGTASPSTAKPSAGSGVTEAAPTSYSQAKADPNAPGAGTSQIAVRPRGRREGMKLGKTPPKPSEAKADGAPTQGGVSAVKDDAPKLAPTANLTPAELQTARDRFGTERTYKTVDELFHQRHPELKGKPIQPSQKELAKEWLGMRAGVEEAGIQKMVAEGKSDPKEIARGVFDARHPDLKGKKLGAAQQKELGEIEKQVNTSLEPLNKLKDSPAFKGLDAEGQKQALALMRSNFADPEARDRVQQAVDSFGSVKSAAGKAQVLEGLAQGSPLTAEKLASTKALLGSPKFAGLSESDQKLVTEGLKDAKADAKYGENVKKLIEDPKFAALGAAEQTAVLSQVKNYPDPRSVGNLQRLIQKDFFTGFDLADKQRALKVVAHLSQHNGDRTIIDNTLSKFLDPSSNVPFDFTATGGYGSASADGKFHFNPAYLGAGNDKVDTSNDDTKHMVEHTVAHEINHLTNNYPPTTEKSYAYFMDEYRAFVTGFKAEHGRDPSRQEVLERAQFLLTATADQSQAYDKIRQALQDPVEGPKIVAFMKKVLGRDDVTQANAGTLAPRNSGDPAPPPEKSAPGDPNNLTNS